MSIESENPPPTFSVRVRARSFIFAWRGLQSLMATQHNAWIHGVATAFVLAVSVLLKISADDWRWIVLAISVVWVAEALNTAVEQLGDAITGEIHPKIGFAKDVAAGAVLISAVGSAVIGALTLLPYVI